MEDKLKDYLEHDERILWSGKPKDYEPNNLTYKSYYMRRNIVTLVIVVALIVGYIIAAINTGAGIKWGVLLVLIAVGVYAMCAPTMDNNKLKKCEYVLTDKKLMLIFPSEVRSVKLEAVPTAKFVNDADGYTSLLCGPDCDGLAPQKYRVCTLTGAILDQNTMMCDRFVMYAVNDPEGLKKAAKGYLTIV